MYAYDSPWYCSGNGISEVRSNLHLHVGLNVASEWFHNNSLLTNSPKSNSILLGTRQRVNDVNIHISNNVLKQWKESKLLGLIIDESLQWDRHIDY